MPEPVENAGRSKMPLAILGIIIAAAGGFAIGWQSGTSKATKASYDQGFAAARAEDKAKLETLGFARPTIDEEGEILSLSGTVTAVNADSFDMTVSIAPASPLDEAREYPVTVKMSAETKITLQSRVSEEEFMAAMEKFRAARESTERGGDGEERAMIEPPSMFVESAAKMADLAVGQSISVETSEDARDKSNVTAASIVINETEVIPGPESIEEPGAENASQP